MPAVDELLADLAAHPPSPPTPVGEIQGRARRRVRRRRVLAGAAAALVVVVAGVGVGAAVTADDPGDEVHADGGATTASSTPSTTGPPTTASVPVTAAAASMTLDPAAGFVDGTVVSMALDEPATGPAIVIQCTAEAEVFAGSPDILPWCTGLVEARAEALEPYALTRTITTPEGEVDCAEAIGRCTLGVRVGDVETADLRTAALAFRTDLEPQTEPTVVVDGDEGTVGDGDALLVTLTGVETGDQILVQQCLSDEPGDAGCTYLRSRAVSVREGPETQLTFTAFHDVYGDTDPSEDGYEPGWVRCEPCEVVVRVGESFAAAARLPLVMEPTATPIRPSIALDPAGAHRPGQAVDVRVTGLQPSSAIELGWCLAEPPWGGGGSACSGPQGEMLPDSYDVADDGTLVVEGFVLPGPDDEVGDDCFAAPGVCGVGIDGSDGGSVAAFAPLDLTG